MMNGNPRALWVFLIAVLCLFGGLPFAKGALYIAQHEGDTLHLADIVFREVQGQWPHLDFMTPIGVLAMTGFSRIVNTDWRTLATSMMKKEKPATFDYAGTPTKPGDKSADPISYDY